MLGEYWEENIPPNGEESTCCTGGVCLIECTRVFPIAKADSIVFRIATNNNDEGEQKEPNDQEDLEY